MDKISKDLEKIYREFRLRLHKNIFQVLKEREGSLSATEFFSAEVIFLMDKPTVSQFADFLGISSSHAAYKVKTLIAKGYVVKIPTSDKRVFKLDVTDRLTRFYKEDDYYGNYIMKKVSDKLNEKEQKSMETFFGMIADEIDIQNLK